MQRLPYIVAHARSFCATENSQPVHGKKQDASQWKKDLVLHHPTWGIDVPSCRVQGHSPTFGSITLFFFQKSTTRSYYLMNFSQVSMRGAEIWQIWKQHHFTEGFWHMFNASLLLP